MTSKKLEALNELLFTYRDTIQRHDAIGSAENYDAKVAAHNALVDWMDQYGQAQRREGRRDVKGRSPRKSVSGAARREEGGT